jgi:long-subunit acyl-CoA synthetase (AMP-forming)
LNRGYKDNPEETAKPMFEDGWLRTGDLGYMDEKGYLYIYDRLKEMIKYKG